MKIKTLVAVSYNSGIASQETSIIEGKINFVSHDYLRKAYTFTFQYVNENGEVINTNSSNFSLTKEEIDAFYDVVKSSIPKNINYFENTEYIYYLGFKIEMAKTFGINVSNIEIITN